MLATGSPAAMPSAATSAADFAPTSRNTMSRGKTLVRSSAGITWMSRTPVTACTGPLAPTITQRWPIRAWSSQPPSICMLMNPSGVTRRTMPPNSSMWASIMIRGPVDPDWAITPPTPS